ncbi:AAA family ATPase [Desulfuromonas carbonis]|uniref:AAA family ATPase n=1 Tax=Desulfuromonas sp. DDH964 TaxID=1823759 RepID=UPI00078D4EB0|nr:AAA family ATPase [Desulfuromonas sp. DDH964]AMV71471.1 AAA ATPase [Desulfuromonas sp. DDH964]
MSEILTLAGFCRLVAAGTPLLHICGPSEERCEALLQRASRQAIKGLPELRVWSCSDGFSGVAGSEEPLAGVRWAIEQEGPGLFLFKDLEYFWDDPKIQRLLKDFAHGRRLSGKSLVFFSGRPSVPDGLEREVTLLEQRLPDREELQAWLEAHRERDPLLGRLLAEAGDPTPLLLAAQGLEVRDLEQALRLGRVSKGAGLADLVAALHRAKHQVIARTGIMEAVDNDLNPDQVGGMDALKGWMDKRERAFGLAGLTAGTNLPKGVLLMGISGCGKSLFVKAIAARWHLPLLRLDMATVYAGTFGSPETSLRRACLIAESLAPCVLWIDEIEAGISSQGFKAEGGAASRVLGYFLTWMQEKSAPVFVAATANAIEMLPAELLRKGRFDEIFYLALPGLGEREEIFTIHLRRRELDPAAYQVGMLAHGSKGFSGAEIEQAVASACFEALARQRPPTQQDIMEAIGRTVPLSVTMAEQIKKIEAWAFKRAVPASKSAER